MDKKFWKDKRVLITGHTGFKGSWLSIWLHKLGAKVIGYSLPAPSQPSLYEITGLREMITSIHGDIRDLKHLQRVYNEYQPEIIIHMAAQALVRESYHNPVETYETNIMGTVHVLEAARHVESIRVIVSVTSDKCYENREWHWGYRENEAMGGYDPYSSSKGCAELVAAAYRRSFYRYPSRQMRGISLATARAGNVIGGGDWAKDRLVPDIMQAYLEKRKVVIRFPGALRPWQHVLEPIYGYLLLAEKLWGHGEKFEGGWNFGPNDSDARPVSWIVDKLAFLCEGGIEWEISSDSHRHEANYLKLDCSKAKNLLGWTPSLNLSTALQWIVRWYKSFQDGDDILKASINDITQYEKIL